MDVRHLWSRSQPKAHCIRDPCVRRHPIQKCLPVARRIARIDDRAAKINSDMLAIDLVDDPLATPYIALVSPVHRELNGDHTQVGRLLIALLLQFIERQIG